MRHLLGRGARGLLAVFLAVGWFPLCVWALPKPRDEVWRPGYVQPDPIHVGIPESTWAYVLGLMVAAIIVGLIASRFIRDWRVARRLARTDPELLATIKEQERRAVGAIGLAAHERLVIERRHSLWSDVGRFLAFWRSRSI